MGRKAMNSHNSLLVLILLIAFSMVGCAGKEVTTQRSEAYQAYQNGDYEMAAQKFESLVGEIPKDAELWFRLGNSYAKAKQPQKAIEAYENALLRDPEMAKAWHNKGIIYLQRALKSFVDMQTYVPAEDPVAKQGKIIRDRVFEILEGSAENEHNIE